MNPIVINCIQCVYVYVVCISYGFDVTMMMIIVMMMVRSSVLRCGLCKVGIQNELPSASPMEHI